MDARIRKGTIEDSTKIATIHIRGWQAAYRHILPVEKLDALSLPEWDMEWKVRLRNEQSIVLIIEEAGVGRGFIAFGPSHSEGRIEIGLAEIYAVYIDPEMKGKGFGKLLCQAAYEHLQNAGYSQILLWVLEENTQAQQFYESIGFEKTSKIKNVEILGVSVKEIQYQKECQAL